ICSIRDWGRYCASTIRSKMPEFTQFDNGKSMMRYLPANGTAGLARFCVSTPSLEPSPPARIIARVFMVSSVLDYGVTILAPDVSISFLYSATYFRAECGHE